MARTVMQQMGDAHEADIAEWTKGIKQKASGSQWHRQGDTKNGEFMVSFPITGDGKSTMGNSIAVSRKMWEKIVEQTFNQHPALFLRFYKPDETRLTVDIDLAVIRSGLFMELLEAARKWAVLEEAMSGDDAPTVDEVLAVVADGMKWREQEDAFRELVQLGREMGPTTVIRPDFKDWPGPLAKTFNGVHPVHTQQLYFCPTAEEVESQEGSGFDVCCDRKDLHVPLPDGEGTEKLSRMLSDRARQKFLETHVVADDSDDPEHVEDCPGCVTESGCDCCR